MIMLWIWHDIHREMGETSDYRRKRHFTKWFEFFLRAVFFAPYKFLSSALIVVFGIGNFHRSIEMELIDISRVLLSVCAFLLNWNSSAQITRKLLPCCSQQTNNIVKYLRETHDTKKASSCSMKESGDKLIIHCCWRAIGCRLAVESVIATHKLSQRADFEKHKNLQKQQQPRLIVTRRESKWHTRNLVDVQKQLDDTTEWKRRRDEKREQNELC